MYKYFTANNTKRYIDITDPFAKKHNNTKYSSTKMKPFEVRKKENENSVIRKSFPVLKADRLEQNFPYVTKSEFKRKRKYFKKARRQIGLKKSSPFHKYNVQ